MRLITETKSPFRPVQFRASILALLILPFEQGFGAIQDVVGHYGGLWSNITYTTTGAAVIDISVTGTNAALTFDMDDGVFGGSDPAQMTMPGTVQGDVIQIDNQGVGIYGDIKGAVDSAAGTLTATLTNIPNPNIQDVTVTGTVTNGTINLDYTVDFPYAPGNPAHGIMIAVIVPALTVTNISIQRPNVVLKWRGGIAPFTIETRGDFQEGMWTNAGASTGTNVFMVPYSPRNAFFRVYGR